MVHCVNYRLKYKCLLFSILIVLMISNSLNMYLKSNYPSAFSNHEYINSNEDTLYQKDSYNYKINPDGTVFIVAYVGDDVASIRVPNKIDGKPVCVLGEACLSWLANVKEIYVPSSVVVLEGYVFAEDPSLMNIYFEGDIEKIEDDTFVGFDGKLHVIQDSNIYEYGLNHNMNLEITQ